DDQVDVTTRAFLGLTVGCAQCHDHKYDPIPTQDYYSLLGIFRSSQAHEIPLAPDATVDAYKAQKQRIDRLTEEIGDYVEKAGVQLAQMLAHKTARYMVAAWEVQSGRRKDAAGASRDLDLDQEILERWIEYLKASERDHPYLKAWDQATASGA